LGEFVGQPILIYYWAWLSHKLPIYYFYSVLCGRKPCKPVEFVPWVSAVYSNRSLRCGRDERIENTGDGTPQGQDGRKWGDAVHIFRTQAARNFTPYGRRIFEAHSPFD